MTLPFFLAVALKGVVVLAIAGLATLLLRRAPASARHGVWAAAFCGLLLLPVLEAVGPRWDVSVLPASASSFQVVVPTPPVPPAPPTPVLAFAPSDVNALRHEIAALEADAAAFEAEMAAFEAEAEAFAAEASAFAVERAAFAPEAATAVAFLNVAPASGRAWPSAALWVAGLWALGAFIVALGWLSAFLSARRLVRTSTPELDEEWAVLAERARRLSGLPDRVRLLRTDRLDVPIAWGYGRPAVVLPASADEWTTERREAVLLHEMAHLRRHDAWTQVLAQAALALHWANPLAWVGYRKFLDAREQACDDAVLQGGARPSAYAQHLVGVARNLRRDRFALAAVAPMARRVPLESRVCSILDASRRRSSLGRPAFRRALGLAMLVVIPLAALRPVAVAQEAPEAPPVPPAPLVDVRADLDAALVEADRAEAIIEAVEVDLGATERDLAAAHVDLDEARADIEAALHATEAVEDLDIDLSGLDDLDIDVQDLDLSLEDLEGELEEALGRLSESEARIVRIVRAKVEHDEEVCPETLLATLKEDGLDIEVRDDVAQVIVDLRAHLAEARSVRAETRAEAESSTIAVRTAERDAQRAAAEARRHALSFSARGSTPPRRLRVAQRADSLAAAVFDWDAVDHARHKAVRHHRASS